MKLEAPLRQLIERRAGAPVEGQKPAGLAGSRRGYLGPLHDDDLDPAATEEIRCTGADYTAAADYDPHDLSIDPRGVEPTEAQFIGYPLARPPD
jgi:hypothetical protein